jgi:hypothetical protein
MALLERKVPAMAKSREITLSTLHSFEETLDRVREGVVLVLGRLARFLPANNPRVKTIIRSLFDVLNTPSAKVQKSVAKCLVPLVHVCRGDAQVCVYVRVYMCVCVYMHMCTYTYANTYICTYTYTHMQELFSLCFERLADEEDFAVRIGASYGVAALVRGLKYSSIKRYVCVCVRMCVCVCADSNTRRSSGMYVSVCVCVCVCVRTQILVDQAVYKYVCVYACVCGCVCECLYFMFTNKHTHTHKQVQPARRARRDDQLQGLAEQAGCPNDLRASVCGAGLVL